MPSNARVKFRNVIHYRDNVGPLCNTSVGTMFSEDEQEVTCNKCKKFLEHPRDLEIARKHRESEEYKRAQERAAEKRAKRQERRR